LRKDLYTRRNEMLQQMGLSVRVRPSITPAKGGRSMKRPTAAQKVSRACDADVDHDDKSDAKVEAPPTAAPFSPLAPLGEASVDKDADDINGEDLWSGDCDGLFCKEEEMSSEPKPRRSKRARGEIFTPAVDPCDPIAPVDRPTTSQSHEETQRGKIAEPSLRGHLQFRLEFSSDDYA
jgi:hypothetical protein